MPTVIAGNVLGFTVIVGHETTVLLNVCEPLQGPLPVAVIMMLYVPVVVGVPERTPPVESVTPGGNPVADQVTVPLPPVWV